MNCEREVCSWELGWLVIVTWFDVTWTLSLIIPSSVLFNPQVDHRVSVLCEACDIDNTVILWCTLWRYPFAVDIENPLLHILDQDTIISKLNTQLTIIDYTTSKLWCQHLTLFYKSDVGYRLFYVHSPTPKMCGLKNIVSWELLARAAW